MVDRRTFTALLAGALVAPKATFAQNSMTRNVFYSAVGPELTLYSVDVDNAALVTQGTVSTPTGIQYAWPHPSKRYLYVASSNGGPASSGGPGDKHIANAFKIDPATGALTPHGEAVALPSRPIHTSVDRSGQYLLTAYNDPSSLPCIASTRTARSANASISPMRSTPENPPIKSLSRRIAARSPGDARQQRTDRQPG
jgi:6-phosphogluconolactonase (cycloisomerase 2 family)